jgi:hypothetical protein
MIQQFYSIPSAFSASLSAWEASKVLMTLLWRRKKGNQDTGRQVGKGAKAENNNNNCSSSSSSNNNNNNNSSSSSNTTTTIKTTKTTKQQILN